MASIEENFKNEQQKISNENATLLNNFSRCLTMLEKTLERMARQNWHNERQYPEIYFEILVAIYAVREWIEKNRIFSNFQIFQDILVLFITSIADQISMLIETTRPSPGKKSV